MCALFYLCVFYITLFVLKLLLTQQTGIRVQVIRPRMTTKFEIETFDGKNDFSLEG